ncbi:Pentatricopeptide repeat [Melia azedarach]|uniref:Pentatricopeptide repeat n=1 Tax=Melia azedarach TaxID=155640 RepID=A0ACC1XB90_MELAZ|nr:Pentatricopeptide repeat [Melia azedarach]
MEYALFFYFSRCISNHAHLHLYPPFRKHFSDQSWLPVSGNTLYSIPTENFSKADFSIISDLLRNPNISSGPSLESALNRTGVEPHPALVQAVLKHFDCSPKLLHTLFLWAESKAGFKSSATLFNSMVNVLAKAKEFGSAWSMVHDKVSGHDGPDSISKDTFAILIRRYVQAGMTQPAIKAFEFANNLELVNHSDSGTSLFEILLDSLCKEGHVKVASDYFDKRKVLDQSWAPSTWVYNILLNGWFRSKRLLDAERFWLHMRRENVTLSVVTYGILVEGYCRMRRIEKAVEVVKEMRNDGIEPNAIVYNSIIDGFAEAGRFEEVSRMMERFLLCESGPNMFTYTSLVKGYCKVGDLEGASKILKTMISRGFIPTATTYNYFFKYFSKFRKIEEAMNLFTKMIESGYTPDRLTYHLLLNLLCKEERLELVIQVCNEMKTRGCDMNLDASTMLIDFLCRMYKYEEAFAELEDMIRRGIVPQYLTFQKMNHKFKKRGMTDMAEKLQNLMSSLPHSMKLPDSWGGDQDASHARRRTIIQKAETMSHILKTSRDHENLLGIKVD